MELIKFDIIVSDEIITDVIGGAREDRDIILKYLNNYKNKYLISTKTSDHNEYIFEVINDDKNRSFYKDELTENNDPYTSTYIAAGLYSTAIAVKLIKPRNGTIQYPETLVFKLLGVKKNKHPEYYENWNNNFYGNYKNDVREFGNLMLEIYFYGDNVINRNFDKENNDQNENYKKCKEFLEKKKLCFNISKFHGYQMNLSLNEKKIFIMKTISVINYLYELKYFINDFKNDNIACDQENLNLKCIDVDNDTINKFYINHQYIYKHLKLGTTIPAYLKKIFYVYMHNEIFFVKQLISIRDDYINAKSLKNNYVNPKKINDEYSLIYNLLKLKDPQMYEQDRSKFINKCSEFFDKYNQNGFNYHNINRLFGTFMNKNLLSNYEENILMHNIIRFHIEKKDMNIGIDKFSCFGLAEVLIKLFFAPYGEIDYKGNINNGPGTLRCFYYGGEIFNQVSRIRMESPEHEIKNSNYIYWYSSFQNLNNIEIINKFVYEFLQPLNPNYIDVCNKLKTILFDEISETGLLAPEYDDIPPFSIIFKDLAKNIFNSGEIIDLTGKTTKFNEFYNDFNKNKNYKLFYQQLIEENIKLNANIIWNEEDVRTLEDWQRERIIFKQMHKYHHPFIDYLKTPSKYSLPKNSRYFAEYYEVMQILNEQQYEIEETKEKLKYKYLKYKQKYLKLKNQIM